MKRRLPLPRFVRLALCVITLAGCDFVDAVSEVTVGAGKIPRIEVRVALPGADEVLNADGEAAPFPGLPSRADGATLAHVEGLLRLRGVCAFSHDSALLTPPLEAAGASLARCDGVDTCGDLCAEGFEGLFAELRTTVTLVTADDTDNLRSQLSQLSPDAIVQIRLRVHALGLVDDAGHDLDDHLTDYEMRVETPSAGDAVLVQYRHLSAIGPDTPQRFEFPSGARITAELKDRVLAAEPFAITLVHRFQFPPWALYEVVPARTSLVFDLQPEFVISVLEAVEDQ
jgi:hypothetical protein